MNEVISTKRIENFFNKEDLPEWKKDYDLPKFPAFPPLVNHCIPHIPNPIEWQYKIQPQYSYEYITKIMQAKKVAIEAISTMKNGDTISVVIFDDTPVVVVPATDLNDSNRSNIISKINSLTVGGSTNLHGGWVTSATEVAKNIKKETINRVILLTDGETNCGIKNTDEIVKNVSSLYEKHITTTTFGIGQTFNEDLLQKMATSGNGNFYYIKDETGFAQMFKEEFSGLSNVVATDIKINFNEMNIKDFLNMNSFNIKDKTVSFPNIISNQKQNALFKLSFTPKKGAKTFAFGKIKISYLDLKGDLCEQTITIPKMPIVDDSVWQEAESNEEIKVNEVLLVVAENKTKAIKALDQGDFQGASGMLRASHSFMASSKISDVRLANEMATLNNTISTASAKSGNELRKDLSYQSYQTRHQKI
jgi:Ca-activated chloride channel family protein